jgi:L-aminopeptidase/D-esterase-like protein
MVGPVSPTDPVGQWSWPWSVVVGPTNSLTDVAGIEVGHETRIGDGFLTGTTAVLCRGGAVAGVDVRGGAPATRETDALDPRNLVHQVHGVVLTGGSAFGLDAAGGTMRWLLEQGVGRPIGPGPGELIPIVPAAAIFDLGRGGNFAARPDQEFGYLAAAAAGSGPVLQGLVGAGTGASSGALVGAPLKGGLGSASASFVGGPMVGAMVVLNPAGSAMDPRSGLLYGVGTGLGSEFAGLLTPTAAELGAFLFPPLPGGPAPGAGAHTVIAVVATDAELTKAEAAKMAGVAHDGLARAVRPTHTLFDGDTIFALATGVTVLPDGLLKSPVPRVVAPIAGSGAASPPASAARTPLHDASLCALFEVAADCISRAVVWAALSAAGAGGLLSYRQAFPSAVEGWVATKAN